MTKYFLGKLYTSSVNIYNIGHVLLKSFVELLLLAIESGGKRNEDLILPINSSLSVTLHQEQVTDSPYIISPVSIGRFTTMHFKSSRILAVTARLPLYTIILSQLKTTTTIACSRSFQQDRIWLNGKEEDISCPRLQSCLQESTSLTFRTLTLLSTV